MRKLSSVHYNKSWVEERQRVYAHAAPSYTKMIKFMKYSIINYWIRPKTKSTEKTPVVAFKFSFPLFYEVMALFINIYVALSF